MLQVAQAPNRGRRQPYPGASSDDPSENVVRPARILVVEDDYFVALELEHRLREAGYEVVAIAATAEEAIDSANIENPDLAIMDIRLAGERDGVDAAIELFTKFGIRSIFATAHGDPETKARTEPAHPAGWLQKPYSGDTLVAAVRVALGSID